jgi:hypothetical protein
LPFQFLSGAELARLSGWPDEIADADLITYFTLTRDDIGWLTSNVRVENRLGAALQLCTLSWLGWIPDDLTACPAAAVDRVVTRLGLAGDDLPGVLAAYGDGEGRTRRDHRSLVLARVGWRTSVPVTASDSMQGTGVGGRHQGRGYCHRARHGDCRKSAHHVFS